MVVNSTYLGEQLKEVATLVKVNKDIQALNGFKVFLQHQARLLQASRHIGVVCLRDLDELHSASLQVGDVADNVVGLESDVLDTGTVVEVHILLDLGLLLALGRLIDGHLDDLVGRRHDDTLQGREFTTKDQHDVALYFVEMVDLRANLAVVNGPKAVEAKCLLVAREVLAIIIPVAEMKRTHYSQILSISFQSWLPTQ